MRFGFACVEDGSERVRRRDNVGLWLLLLSRVRVYGICANDELDGEKSINQAKSSPRGHHVTTYRHFRRHRRLIAFPVCRPPPYEIFTAVPPYRHRGNAVTTMINIFAFSDVCNKLKLFLVNKNLVQSLVMFKQLCALIANFLYF